MTEKGTIVYEKVEIPEPEKKKRLSPVESAKARLEAAQKRERLAMLKRAKQHLDAVIEFLDAAGGVEFVVDGSPGLDGADTLRELHAEVLKEIAG